MMRTGMLGARAGEVLPCLKCSVKGQGFRTVVRSSCHGTSRDGVLLMYDSSRGRNAQQVYMGTKNGVSRVVGCFT
jgi:hypothetical protein